MPITKDLETRAWDQKQTARLIVVVVVVGIHRNPTDLDKESVARKRTVSRDPVVAGKSSVSKNFTGYSNKIPVSLT